MQSLHPKRTKLTGSCCSRQGRPAPVYLKHEFRFLDVQPAFHLVDYSTPRSKDNRSEWLFPSLIGENKDPTAYTKQSLAPKLKSTLFRFRFILNIHELVVIGDAIKCMEQGQNGFPIWSLYMISISHLMLSLNSSTNIFIYFFLSSRFRQDCKRRYSRMKNTIRHE